MVYINTCVLGIGFFRAFSLGKLIGLNHIMAVCVEYICCIQFSLNKKKFIASIKESIGEFIISNIQ